ncbi:hypothetical protein [Burkholderia mallei]|uniref:hypothetical protein n=1 Tax=Burkholderia mallei TaxID=13373 RepID=UPI003B97D051
MRSASGEDGPTHQSVEHVASLRLIPNLDVWRPADTVETAGRVDPRGLAPAPVRAWSSAARTSRSTRAPTRSSRTSRRAATCCATGTKRSSRARSS